MQVTIEFAAWPASDAYVADPRAVLKDLANIIEVHTFGFYHGLQLENPKMAYLVVIWESYEMHMELVSNPKFSEDLNKVFENAVEEDSSQEIVMKHIVFADRDLLEEVLNAPVTEFLFSKSDGQGLEGGVLGTQTESDEVLVLRGSKEGVQSADGAVKVELIKM